jgi:DNA-binding ferritin-like protein (Dps family)
MSFTLKIETDNAAFSDDDTDYGSEESANAKRAEVARILREVADLLDNGSQEGAGVYDVNGNRVGKWSLN